MGLRGPKGRSTKEKMDRGNPGHVKKPPEDLPAKAQRALPVPNPPTWVSKEGKEVWHRLAPDLVKMGTLTHLDVDLFGKYCQLIGTAILQEKAIKGSPYQRNSNNTYSEKMESKIAKACWSQAEKLAPHFGLSPKHRKAMGLQVPGAIDSPDGQAAAEADQLLNG